jgi:hypothetical protein
MSSLCVSRVGCRFGYVYVLLSRCKSHFIPLIGSRFVVKTVSGRETERRESGKQVSFSLFLFPFEARIA